MSDNAERPTSDITSTQTTTGPELASPGKEVTRLEGRGLKFERRKYPDIKRVSQILRTLPVVFVILLVVFVYAILVFVSP